MHLRRTIALTIGALLLLALTGCVKDFATDRPYTPAAGTNSQEASVDVLNAVIVATEDGAGTFIATFANNTTTESTTFETLEGIDQAQVTVGEFAPMDIPASGALNLATDGGVEVTGDFELGDFVPVSVQFGTGEQVEMDVPVVPNCGDFAELDGPADESLCETHESEDH